MPQNRASKDASGAKATSQPTVVTGSPRSKVVSSRRRLSRRSAPPLSAPRNSEPPQASTQPRDDLTATPPGDSEPISGASASPPVPASKAEATTQPKDDLAATPPGDSEPISGASASPPVPKAEATTQPKDDLTATPPCDSEPISGASASPPVPASKAEATTQPRDDLAATPPGDSEPISGASASPPVPASKAEATTQPKDDLTATPPGDSEPISGASASPPVPAFKAEATTQPKDDLAATPLGDSEPISGASASPPVPASKAEATTQPKDDLTATPPGDSEPITGASASSPMPASKVETTTRPKDESLRSDNSGSISDASTEFVKQASEEDATTQHKADSLPSGHPESISVTAAEHATQASEEEVTTQHTGDSLPSGHPESISVTTAEHATRASEGEVTTQHTALPSSHPESISVTAAEHATQASEEEVTTQHTDDSSPPGNPETTSDAGASSVVPAFEGKAINQPTGECKLLTVNNCFDYDDKEEPDEALVVENTQSIDNNELFQYIHQEVKRNSKDKLIELLEILNTKIFSMEQLIQQQAENIRRLEYKIVANEETTKIIDVGVSQTTSPSGTIASISSATVSSMKQPKPTNRPIVSVSETGIIIEPTVDLSPSSTAEFNSSASASSLKTVSVTGATIEPTADLSPSSTAESNSNATASSMKTVSETGVTTEPTADCQKDEDVESREGSVVRNIQSIDPKLVQHIIREVNGNKDPEITKGQDIEYKDTNLAKEEAHENNSVREAQIMLSSGNADSNSGATGSCTAVSGTGVIIEPTADSSSTSTHRRSPPLTFHRPRGTGIRVSRDGSTVMKLDDSEIEFVYSDRPIEIGETVYLRFLEVRNFDPWFTVGFTSREPMSSVTPISLEFVENRCNRVYWTKNLKRNLYKNGTLLSYYVNPAGEIHFKINNEYKGILAYGVDTNVPLWVCLIIATYGTTLQFVDPQSLAQTEMMNSLSEEPMSAMNLLSFNNLPTHFDSEINYVSYIFTEKPLNTKHMIFIKILNVEKARSGSLAIGVTSCDPKTLKSSKLPDDPEMLKYRPEHWEVCSDVVNDLERDDELEVTMTVDREIQISRNGAPAFTVMHIYNLEPLWAFVYTYGATQKSRILIRRQISSSYNSKTSKKSKHYKSNITHAKCSSSMTPVFGQKASFQSPFGRLFNFGTSPRSTFDDCNIISDTSASATNNASTNTPNACLQSYTNDSSEMLRFHSAPGGGIRVSTDGSTAMKLNGASMGSVCSARPVNIGEKVCLRLLEVGDFDSWLAVGFTSHEPMSPFTGSTPECVENMSNHLSWMKVFKRDIYTKGTILCYFVNLAGEVHFEIGGEYKGILIEGVDISDPLWVCLIMAKRGTTLQFVDPRNLPKTETPDSVLNGLLSGMDINLPIRFDSKTDNVSYVFTGKPLETSQIISIKILKTEKTHLENLSIGVTSCDPTTLLPSDLPDDVEMLDDRPEYWEVNSDVVNRLKEGDEFKVTLTVNEEVQVSRNGAPAFTVLYIDDFEPLWAFVYTYGATQQTRILTSSHSSNLYSNKLKTPLLSSAKSVVGANDSSKATVSGARGTITQPAGGPLSNSNTSKVILRAPKLNFTGSTSSKASESGTSSNSVQSAAGGSFNSVTSNSLISGGSKLACGSSTSATIPVFEARGTSTQPTAGSSFNFVISNSSTSGGSKTACSPTALSTMQVPGAGDTITQPTPDGDVVTSHHHHPNQSNASGTPHVRPKRKSTRKIPSRRQ
ncbi:hypothetical protein K1T71_014387 [Dendrolimus kikuchii]|uniref:Uncharacterized protein n=1 Tax=Dendrolimus kikuchii TaxID=765133 RepID=A0ACC1CE12_9NEOP|nr:hypothetical protein K1T71_014387 [Dendrolimus kikuchii]